MPARRVAVAASGGRDSTALLHCTARAVRELGIEVVALHVHHGLVPQADDWLDRVRAQARRWGAAFDARRLQGPVPKGESIEAWARRGRYRALAEMAHVAGCSIVLLAHHRRDQAETWLLQALRGGGPRGLAAMPRLATREGLCWARPWLDMPREAVEAYVRRHRLAYVDDGSNEDPRFARNALRREAWPGLQRAFPQAEAALADAARHAQQAAALAAEVAALDLPALRKGDALDVAAWLALPPARRANALQAWLAGLAAGPLPDSLLRRLATELPRAKAARWPAPGGELRLYRGRLERAAEAAMHDAGEAPSPLALDLSSPGFHTVSGWDGHFMIGPCEAGGIAPERLRDLRAAARQGGERFALTASRPARSLKKQFQARSVPAWAREGPLLFTPAGELVFVPGLGIAAPFQAPAGQAQLAVVWRPGPPGRRQPAG